MANIYDRKLRGLFIIETDEPFSDTHPLWKIITMFQSLQEETHVLVFTKNKVPTTEAFIERGNFFLYQFQKKFFWFRLLSLWETIVFNLSWHKRFRPDFIVNLGGSKGACIGLLLSRRFKKKFFVQLRSHFLDRTKASFSFQLFKYAVAQATGVFVPGEETALLFRNRLHIADAQLFTLQPPVDIAALSDTHEKYDFHAAHPQHNFFIVSVLQTKNDFSLFFALYKKVAQKYPRVAFVALVRPDMVASVRSKARHAHLQGVIVYPSDDKESSLIKGAHVYLAVSHELDVDTHMLSALSLLVPVVTTEYGIAEDVFKGSRYAEFMQPVANVVGIAEKIVLLIENSQVRADYALNTKALFANLHFDTTETYAQKMYADIESIVRPTLPKIEDTDDIR